MFSNNAQTANKWNTSGGGFSADDGIWGAQNGTIDGNTPGPYLSSEDGDIKTTTVVTVDVPPTITTTPAGLCSSIKNLMYFR